MGQPSDGSAARARRRGYLLTAAVLLAIMLGGTLPVPLYVRYEQQFGSGPLGVTVVFAAYVLGTLFALVVRGRQHRAGGGWLSSGRAAARSAVR